MPQYPLVIIGAGPGGYVAAIKAAQLGIEAAVIECEETGGTCLNRGCIPTKTLLHTADLFAELQHAETIGLRVEGASLDYEALRARKNDVVDRLRTGVEGLLEANGVARISGRAFVNSSHSVTVALPGGSTEELTADHLIVATGSRPAMPPIPGIDLPGVHTSDTLLEEVPELSRLVVIGGGVIGMEFAGIYTSLGTQVTVLEAAPRILPTMDREFGQSLSMSMKKRGCVLATGALVEKIEEAPSGGLSVQYRFKDDVLVVEADAVLVSTGRTACTRDLFATSCMPNLDRGRIAVDEHMRTSVEGIYAIGDVSNAGIQLAHAASAQGIAAACHLANEPCTLDLTLTPACVYTSPEIASVGLTEAEAKEAGLSVRTGKFAMAGNGKTIITEQDRSYVKIIATEDGTLVGAQLMCGRATDMIGELAVAIAQRLTVEEFASVIRPHPTFEESLGEAAESLLGGAIHALPRKR